MASIAKATDIDEKFIHIVNEKSTWCVCSDNWKSLSMPFIAIRIG